MPRFLITAAALAAVASLAVAPSLKADSVYGGPTYDSTTGTGYTNWVLPIAPGSTAGEGIAVGYADKYSAGTNLGYRAILWDTTGFFAELDNLGTSNTGYADDEAYAINSNGTVIGYASKYSAGTNLGYRAVRWDSTFAATELGNLGTDSNGNTTNVAWAINNTGTAVGYGYKYTAGTNLGIRAIRWDSTGTAATELGNLGTDSNGKTTSVAIAINDTGTAVGYADKYNAGTQIGSRAVRWDAGATTATELDNLGTNTNGSTTSQADDINATGTAIGYAEKYSSGTNLGSRAVRWDAGGTAATELGNIGTDSNGYTSSEAVHVNAAGTAIGFAEQYSGNLDLGPVATRWDSTGTAATQLGNLGTDNNGYAYTEADGINDAGLTVGFASQYSNGMEIDQHAVVWGADGVAIDLNTLLSPQDAAHWTLDDATAITDTDWISGVASFDPDGAGPDPAYSRSFLISLPEPATLSLLAMGAILLRRRVN